MKLSVISDKRKLDSYGDDINIYAKGLAYPKKVQGYKIKGLPKTRNKKLVLIIGGNNGRN